MMKHTHDVNAEPTIWHEGSLGDCPDTVYDPVEGGRIARGFCADYTTEYSLKRITNVPEIK